MKAYGHLWQYLAYFLEWEMFQKKFLETLKTQILCPINFFPNIVPFMRQYGNIW
jgi:hypothetical protein